MNSKTIIFWATAAAIATSPANAETNFFEMYRRDDGPSRAVIETARPYEEVKKCVLEKVYAIDGFAAPSTQITKAINDARRAGETIYWGDTNGNSIDFLRSKDLTTVQLYGNFLNTGKLPDGRAQLPSQIFSYLSECMPSAGQPTEPSQPIKNLVYQLDSKASHNFMAECVLYALDYRRFPDQYRSLPYAIIKRDPSGRYDISFHGYNYQEGESIKIASYGPGSRTSLSRPPQTAFLVVKLDSPAKDFDREWAEQNHFLVSVLKRCADIAEGKVPPIQEFPKRKTATEITAPLFESMAKRYAAGEIEMAEMPLEVEHGYILPPGTKFKQLISRQGPSIPAKFIAAAVVATTAAAKGGKPKESLLPLIYIHPRQGDRTKSKEAILLDTAHHLYCDETSGFELKGIAVLSCYQDKDQDGSFETSRTATVKFANSAAYIYFVSEAKPLAEQRKYRLAAANEIPSMTLDFRVMLSGEDFIYCPTFKTVAGKWKWPFFCYLPMLGQQSSVGQGLSYEVPGLKITLGGPLASSTIVSSISTYQAGTLIGKLDPREPITPFGTEPLWIDTFLRGRDYMSLRAGPLEQELHRVGKIAEAGVQGSMIASYYRKARMNLKLAQFIDVGGGSTLRVEPGQSLVGHSASFDAMIFEPARLFACGMERQLSNKGANTFCFVADRPLTGAFFRFVGDLSRIPSSFQSANTGSVLSAATVGSVSTEPWVERLIFDGWSVNKDGHETAKLIRQTLFEGRLIDSVPAAFNLVDGVASVNIGNLKFTIQKTPNGGYQLFNIVEKLGEAGQ
jgi:hypothetical protein